MISIFVGRIIHSRCLIRCACITYKPHACNDISSSRIAGSGLRKPIPATNFCKRYCTHIPDGTDRANYINDTSGVNTGNSLLTLERLLNRDQFDEVSFTRALGNCMSHLPVYSNQQIIDCIQYATFILRKFGFDYDLSEFCECIDMEFNKRAPFWTMDEFLVHFDSFSTLPKIKRSDFIYHVVKNRRSRIISREKEKVVEFIRLMNKCNLWHVYYSDKYNFEAYLNDHLAELSLSDLTIFLDFMVKVRLVMSTPNLFKNFSQFVLNHLPTMSSTSIALFAKFLLIRTFVEKRGIDPVVKRLLQYLTETDHIHATAYIEVAAIISVMNFLYDETFFDKLSSKCLHQFSELPIEKVERALKCLTTFDENVRFSNDYESIVNNLRSESHWKALLEHPSELISIFFHLSKVGIYPHDLLNTLFSEEFLSRAYKGTLTDYPLRNRHVRGRELLTIDSGIEIECPEYRGNRLAAEAKSTIQRYFCWSIPILLRDNIVKHKNFDDIWRKSRKSTKFLFQLKIVLESLLGGSEFVFIRYLLPHFPRPNILFALNHEGVPQRLRALIGDSLIVDRGNICDDLKWYTIGHPLPISDRKSILRDEEISKVRQLKKLSYNVILVPRVEWSEKTAEEVTQLIRTKISANSTFEN